MGQSQNTPKYLNFSTLSIEIPSCKRQTSLNLQRDFFVPNNTNLVFLIFKVTLNSLEPISNFI